MIRYLFGEWQKELISVAADAVECCVTSAYLNRGGVDLLRRIAERLTRFSNYQTQKPIKVLLSHDFAPTIEERNKILFNLSRLPGVEVRIHEGERLLHSKNYIFKTPTDIRVVIGSVNATSGGFFHNIESAALIEHDLNDKEVIKIQDQFHQLWDAAQTVDNNSEEGEKMAMQPKFQKGDNVRTISTGKVGTVNDVLLRPNTIGYRVTIDGRTSVYQEKYLEKFVDEESSILESLALGEFGGANDFRLFETWFRLKRPIEGNFYSYLGSKTIFNPYQFKPLSKFIAAGSEERLFIADEVGVGKTIETGIILTELLARGRIDRTSPILIVCPNSLGPKWVKEMGKRFNLRFYLHDGSSLKTALMCALETGRIPEAMTWGVVSIQTARYATYYDLFEKLSAARQQTLWSLVIIDEAHHMRNYGTESNALGSILSSLTEMMVMLSATPLNLRDEDLFNQMHILNPAMFPDLQTFNALMSPTKSINRCRRLLAERTITINDQILNELDELSAGTIGPAISAHPGVQNLRQRLATGGQLTPDEVAYYENMFISLSPIDNSFTRTLKREAISHRVTREPIKVGVVLSPAEKEFHDAVVDVVIKAYLASGGDVRALGFISNMPRRMVSSCIPAMKEYLDWCIEKNTMIIDEAEEKEIIEDDSELEQVELSRELREAFIILSKQAVELGNTDTKYDEFIILVKRLQASLPNRQLIVFSFFVRTLKYLQKRLSTDGFRVGLICGEVPLNSTEQAIGRYQIMDAFECGEYDILLSSEVGGEGLDFQFCQGIINYDLPYNPMQVEQRIGRIDRFGQSADKVVIGSLYIKDTLDEAIYTALYDRIRIVEDSVGALEPILGNRLLDVQRDIISGQLKPHEIEIRIKEIELAVAQAKQQMEQFENNRKELMGDEYFTTPLHNLQQKSEFVLPSDVGMLAKICLDNWPGCSYVKLDEDRAKIVLSPEKLASLDLFTRRPGSEGSKDELGPLLKGQFPVSVLFNGSLSDQYRDHIFLPPCGFWSRFLLSEMENERTIARTFAIRMSVSNGLLPEGKYIVPLFEVKLEGFRVEMNLAAIPVKITSQEAIVCDYAALSRVINREGVDITNSLSPEDVEAGGDMVVEIARSALEAGMDGKVQELQAENTYRIDARISSLKKGSEVRMARLQARIAEHRERALQQGKKLHPEFIRLTETQIMNEKARTDAKIQALAGKKDLSLSLLLVGIVVLEVK
ncbi:MAG: SNF2-related protein [Smithella sp.]